MLVKNLRQLFLAWLGRLHCGLYRAPSVLSQVRADLTERSLRGLGASSFPDLLRPLLPLQMAMLLLCSKSRGAMGGFKQSELLGDF